MHAGFGDPCAAAPLDDNSGSNERSDMMALVEALWPQMTRDGVQLKTREFTFQELVDACQANECFGWAMEGTTRYDKDTGEEWLELNQRGKSALGLMWSEKFGGQILKLKNGVRVQFGKRGKNRQRRYTLEVLE
jgi:hypothetical protein